MGILEIMDAPQFEAEVLRATEPTVVVFWAAWCPFCRSFRPHFEARAASNGARFAVVRLDSEDNALWDRYGVNVVPSLAYFRDGDLVARKDGRLARGLSEADLDAFLAQVLPAT